MVVMYLHGFRSTPESNKGKIMRKAFSEKMAFLAPDLNVGPTEVKEILLEAVKSISEGKGYQMVIDRASSANIIFASPRIDISNEVLSKLGYSN